MPRIRPFRGVRYNPEKVDLGKIICPPYDAIGSQEMEDLYALSPYNAVRMVLGRQLPKDTRDNNRYTRARNFLEAWMQEKVLVQEGDPALYYHEHSYCLGDRTHTRKGVIASVRMDDGEKKNFRSYEYTNKAPKLDRLRLMNEVNMNMSSVFGVYSDAKKTVETRIRPSLGTPSFEFDSHRETHRVWVINDKDTIEQFSRFMQNKKVLIADGQHRYETARMYRDRMRAATGRKDGNQGFDFIQMYLVNKEEGLTVLPVHRVVTDSMGVGLVDLEYRIKEIFNMIPYDNRKSFLSALNKGGRGHLGLYVRGILRYYLLELSQDADFDRFLPGPEHPQLRNMAVTLLHESVLQPVLGISHADAGNRIFYTSSADEALNLVAKEKADIAFLLNPTGVEDIMTIAETGARLPQNSVFFYPRVPSGLVFHPL
jgi:uncharacterized protein (DUF1015 family)